MENLNFNELEHLNGGADICEILTGGAAGVAIGRLILTRAISSLLSPPVGIAAGIATLGCVLFS